MFIGDSKLFMASLPTRGFFVKALLLMISAKDQRSIGLLPITKHPAAHGPKKKLWYPWYPHVP